MRLTALAAVALATPIFAANPIFTHKYTADPNPIVWNDRLYVYASQDDNNPADKGYNITAYTLMSSDDMANWTDHGEVFLVKRDMPWASQCYAPGAAVRNGKVYLYVPDGGNSIGVAVADRPEGPFTDPLKKGLITKSMTNCNVPWLFDPGAFVDDDGQAYLYFGGGDGNSAGTNLRGIKLNDDMISVSGTAVTISAPCSFEAAYMHKHGGTYYFSYSTNFDACSQKGGNAYIDYLTSSSPLSGFTYRGTLVPNGNIVGGGNNHAGTVLYKDKWYAFYHDRRARAANGLSAGEFRSVSVDVFSHSASGTITQATLTADGPPQIKNFNPYNTIRATTMNRQSGVKTALDNAEGMTLTSISDGDYVRLKGVDFGSSSAASISVRAASAGGGGRIELRTGSATGTLLGTVDIASTGSWSTWQTFTADVSNITGVKDYLYLVFKGTGEPFRIAWYKFNSAEGGSDISVTCNLDNLEPSYVAGSSIPRPNVSCGAGISVGAASFSANGNDITGWNAPGGTHNLYNDGTRAIVLNSVECGGAEVALSPPVTCGSLEITPDPSTGIAATARPPAAASFSVRALGGKSLFMTASSPSAIVEIYDLRGGKATVIKVSGRSQVVKLSLPSGVYFAKTRGARDVRFVLR